MGKQISPEEKEDMLGSLATHAGIHILLEEVDVIINRIRDGIHGCKLSNDPTADGLKLLNERLKLEGAVALKNAMVARLNEARAKGAAR